MENQEEVVKILKEISAKMDMLQDLHREMREVKVRVSEMNR